ncbi:MAG TPA: 7TM diverse intracellular signaling domain-containing protein [Ramlibacter sp.]|nr:7TM diverse intracellular signaling domain-containing protein [Ramlibacter sp.]
MGWIAQGRRAAAALLFLAIVFVGAAAHARTALTLDLNAQPVRMQDAGDAWLDVSGKASVQELARDASVPWHPTAADNIYKVDGGKALWVRFTVPPQANSERWYLEVVYPGVDRVELFVQNASGAWTSRVAGDSVPVANWPVPHRHPVLPLSVSPTEPRVHWLKIQNGTIFGAPLQFVSEGYLGLTEQSIALGLGVYLGLVVLAVVLAGIGGLSLGDKGYWLYAVSAVMMWLCQATLTGLAGLHLWPNSAWWNNMAPQITPLFAISSIQVFFAEAVSLRQRWRLLHKIVVVGALASVPLAIYIMATPDVVERLRLIVFYVTGATIAGLAVVVWAALRGDRYAPWLLLGCLPVAIGAGFPLARAAGLIPVSFMTQYGMQIVIAIELPVLLIVLALRSQHRREHVRRIQGLDRIDPATGLINSAVFHERLVRLIARSQRLKFRSAMLLVDIGNIDHIRRQFDADSARELTLRVAGRLLSVAREIDTVARLSEHRFGILLEGPLHADEVAEAGPRIVARCLMPFKGRPLEWSAHVRVAQALIPMDGTDPSQLIGRLEMLLASAPSDSRRAVFMLSRNSMPAALT